MLIGYARVSTADQNPDHQIDALLRAGVDRDHIHVDTATVEGRAMFGMLSVLAELQRELIVANTNDGLAAARARGRVGGRRPKLTPEQAALAQQLYDAREKTVQQIADLFGVPRSMVYGHLDKTKAVPRQPKKTTVTKP
jgi:DNA invertase Pin-like site-specific DNA recombinase